MNVRLNDVPDVQVVVPGEVDVLLNVPRRVDDGGFAALFITDDVRGDGEAGYEALV